MKTKTFKRIVAATAALMMMSAVPMMNVWADPAPAPSYSITIDNTSKDIADASHTYTAYQIFSGNYDSTSKKLSNIVWGTGVVSENTLVNNKTILDAIKELTDFANCGSAAAVADVLSTLNSAGNEAKVEAFAEKIAPYVTGGSPLASKGTGSKQYTVNLGNNPGYYLVQDTANPVKSSKTRYILQVVESNTTITPKMSVPSIEKFIEDYNSTTNKVNTAELHEEVKYRLVSKVPDMKDYERYYFVVNDKLAPGLELDANSFKVWFGQVSGDGISPNTGTDKYSANSGYYVDVYKDTTDTYDNAFRLVFNNLKNTSESADTAIIITYSAYLGGKVNDYSSHIKYGTSIDNSNENKVNLIYSNDPNFNYTGNPASGNDPEDSSYVPEKPYEPPMVDNPDDPDNPESGTPSHPTPNDPTDDVPTPDQPSSKTPDDKVYTYTSKIKITKTDASGQALYKAGFTLYGADQSGNKDTTNIVRTEIKLDNANVFNFEGLDEGTYYLEETAVPDGYNKAADLKFVISRDIENDNSVTWKTNGSDSGITLDTSNAFYLATVVNKSGATLPSTGGIGTTIFYVSGGSLILGAVVVMITKKRMSLKEDK